MSGNFTPGPWTNVPGRFWICNVGNNVDDPGVWSAYPVKEGEQYPYGDKMADARLIAAAPEYDALLQEALDLIPRMSEDDPIAPALADWCARAKAVMAKARGG